MRKATICITMAAAATAAAAFSAHTESRHNESYRVITAKGMTEIIPLSNDIFRICELTSLDSPTPAATQAAETGYTHSEQELKIHTWANGDRYVVESPTTRVEVDKKTGKVAFYDQEGELLLSEADGVKKVGDEQTLTFLTPEGDNFYGSGERGHSLTLNNSEMTLWNRANYGYTDGDERLSQANINMPYIVSDNGYGLLIDDYAKARLTLGGDTILYRTVSKKPLSYYFINGDGTLAGATFSFTELTGKQPLPPFWTMGYITSKYGYHNQNEAYGAIDSLKQRDYPVDGMVLDLYWYGVETDMGRLEWDKKQWPDHRKMLADMNAKGIHVVPIHQPYINKTGAMDNYSLLEEKGLLTKDATGKTKDVTTWVGDAGMFDIANPSTREWMWERMKPLTAEGLSGWWGDLGEPEVHPLEIVHANGETAEEYHNVYGNEWSKMIYDGLRKDFPEMRPMLMMRGGTTGLQRYGVFPWTSDVSRSWGGLQAQNKLMLNSGLSGLGYMSNDVGGFAVDPAKPYDPELYVRWVQAGTFSPILRTHAQDRPEPYHYPAQEAIIKKFIRMRYEWLPYNYTLAYENSAFGMPLMRTLNFHGDNEDKDKYADIHDEYLWGEEVLVAPVMTPGARSRKVVFPEGTWVDWNNPAKTYRGGTTATVGAPLNTLPLFVKAGSFIPQYPKKIENTSEYDPALLTVKYFPRKEWNNYQLFDDDRLSPTSLEDGEYQLTTFSGSKQGNEIYVNIDSEGSYKGMPETRMITLEIIGVSNPKGVELDGQKLERAVSAKAIRQYGFSYDAAKRTIYVVFPYSYAKTSIKAY
ncbi:MAG: DUF5110 domain-containing protein [Muribaculaceae bacterium]|nr:DUF5110 domain-containing protein [Muribaculaceae bacterium]